MQLSCQCKHINFQVPFDAPKSLFICHCSECKKVGGGLLSTTATFPYFDFPQQGLKKYTWTSDSGKEKNGYFCEQCGNRILHYTPGNEMVRIKAGVLDEVNKLDWKSAEHLWSCREIELSKDMKKWDKNADGPR